MRKRSRVPAYTAITVLMVVVYLVTAGPPGARPNAPGTFSFGALGDAPYYLWEDLQYRIVLQSLDQHDLTWVAHVGDIFWRPCSEKFYRRTLDGFNGLRHPVVFTPGDNEWTDCWESGSGSFAPLERLAEIRRTFFEDPTRSLGGTPLPVLTQADSGDHPEFVENVRWSHEGLVFATVHLVGSRNGLEPFPGRGPDDDDEVKRRTDAAAAWTVETFDNAHAAGALAVVLFFHANPVFERPADDAYRLAFEPFLATLEEQVERFGRPVLAIHGDDHDYIVDQPLIRRTTGNVLNNFTRLQVPGSPEVGWVRVVVAPGAAEPFEFESYVVPKWKYW